MDTDASFYPELPIPRLLDTFDPVKEGVFRKFPQLQKITMLKVRVGSSDISDFLRNSKQLALVFEDCICDISSWDYLEDMPDNNAMFIPCFTIEAGSQYSIHTSFGYFLAGLCQILTPEEELTILAKYRPNINLVNSLLELELGGSPPRALSLTLLRAIAPWARIQLLQLLNG